MSVFTKAESEWFIPGPEGSLQVRAVAGQEGPLSQHSLVAVVCHPHPLHDGTMDNKVVTTMHRMFRGLGVDSVRFNYRGVGASEGSYGEGIGEQQDLLAVIHWLRQYRPSNPLVLAGFSFGAGVAGAVSYQEDNNPFLILVAPSVINFPPNRETSFPCPMILLQGEADEVVDPEAVYQWQRQISSDNEIIRFPETSHFFHGKL